MREDAVPKLILRAHARAVADWGRLAEQTTKGTPSLELSSAALASARTAFDLTADKLDHLPLVLATGELFLRAAVITAELAPTQDGAEKLLVEAIQTAETFFPRVVQCDVRHQVSNVRMRRGMATLGDRLATLTQCLEEYTQDNRTLQVAKVSCDIADVYAWLGDMDGALRHANKAQGIVSKIPMTPPPGAWHAAAERALGEGGDAEVAAATIASASELTDAGQVRWYAASLRGMAFMAGDEPDLAVDEFKRASEQLVGQAGGWAMTANIASALLDSGMDDDALKLMEQLAPDGLLPAELRPVSAGIWGILAEIHWKRNDLPRAKHYVDLASNALPLMNDPDVAWRVWWLQGSIANREQRSESALESFDRAFQAFDAVGAGALGYRVASLFLRAKLPLMNTAVRLASERADALRCLRYIESIKARGLTLLLRATPLISTPTTTPALTDFRKLTSRIEATEFSLTHSPSKQLVEQRAALLSRRRELLEHIRADDPRWKQVTAPPRIEIDALIERLQVRDIAALDLYLGDETVTACCIANGTLSVATHELPSTIVQALHRFATNLTAGIPNNTLYDPVAAEIDAGALIPPAVMESALACSTLVIVPHRLLHMIPWPATQFSGERLIARRNVGVLPNLAALSTRFAGRTLNKQVNLIGAPLGAGTSALGREPVAVEIEDITSVYENQDWSVTAISGESATQDAFVRAPHAPVLHLASHVIADPTDPSHSRFVLADGPLDAAEIEYLRLKYEVVSLSGCNTGWRPDRAGHIELLSDDVVGLPAAFLEAGTSAVLVSIPPAEDAPTRDFMVKYHSELAGGTDPLSAYGSALRAMQNEDIYPAYTWCGFVQYGGL